MGHAPLPWSEIKAWSELTDTPLAPWEAQMIRRASSAYVGELSAENDVSPWRDTRAGKRQGVSFAEFVGARKRKKTED